MLTTLIALTAMQGYGNGPQDRGQRDGGQRDGGPRDWGQRDRGSRDGGRRFGGGPRIIIDGNTLDARGTMRGGRVAVPMRAIFEALGAQVDYHARSKRIDATRGPRTVSLVIGEDVAYTPERTHLDQPPFLINDSVYVPLRFVSESFHYDVRWEPTERTVYVSGGGRGGDGRGDGNGPRDGRGGRDGDGGRGRGIPPTP